MGAASCGSSAGDGRSKVTPERARFQNPGIGQREQG
jgi:hypothetical protein